jgi:type I site-specific restriction-modification system R (restriction) subunit
MLLLCSCRSFWWSWGKRFGEYIDKYKLMDSVDYEGKTADTALNEKHVFDTAFEDLFKDRSAEDLLAIKKKYGATGDLLEAENRINAIAKDLVTHYVDNILPNGFKAQVVCHSKLACIRYQNGIRAAVSERIAVEEQKVSADPDLLAKLKFLKTAVVISSDGTNEAAFVTHARKEAARLNATDNFCKAFNLDDPDEANTGIAFLIVCDMLLTGFDAPIEQVMYIDKKLREHTLLQAIARTNRVAKGKKRGYVVDYIGLANHLTEALTIYAATDELQELKAGLQDISSELPILDERYQRLLQHFDALGGRFCLLRSLVKKNDTETANQAFKNFYADKGLIKIQQRVRHFAEKVGVVPGQVHVKDLGFRWASCSAQGDLQFHWKCMMAPLTVLDYVIVHELCHLHHQDHSQAFWNEVDKVMPLYRERKEWLRVRGAGLDL